MVWRGCHVCQVHKHTSTVIPCANAQVHFCVISYIRLVCCALLLDLQERRKQILSSIGEDLLLAAADQPFRFPATFTFVVRAALLRTVLLCTALTCSKLYLYCCAM